LLQQAGRRFGQGARRWAIGKDRVPQALDELGLGLRNAPVKERKPAPELLDAALTVVPGARNLSQVVGPEIGPIREPHSGPCHAKAQLEVLEGCLAKTLVEKPGSQQG